MDGESLGRVLRRRWYVVLCGAVIAPLVGAMVGQPDGLHYHRAEMVLGTPGTRAGFEEDLPAGSSLIPFAAAVARLAGQDQGLAFPATRAELHASGVRSGTWIRLVDTGGQWSRINSSPTLIVEAVDPDPSRAARLLGHALRRVEGATDTLQTDASVPVAQRIVPMVQHEENHYVGATRFDAARAMVVVIGLGVLFTGLAARGVDVVLQGRGLAAPRHRSGRHRIRPRRA